MSLRDKKALFNLPNRTKRWCSICFVVKPISEFHKDKHCPDGLYPVCKKCRIIKSRRDYRKREHKISEYGKRYRKTDAGRASRKREDLNRRVNHPKQYKANYFLTNAVRDGRIIKGSCEVCGEKKTHGHHTDYNKPLEVMWLCKKHHDKWHRKFTPIY